MRESQDLEKLNLSRVQKNTMHVLLEIIRGSDSDELLNDLAKYCPNLQELDLSYHTGLSGKTIRRVLRRCSQLKVLNISGCWKVTKGVIEWIRKKYPRLQVITSDTTLFEKVSEKVKETAAGWFVRLKSDWQAHAAQWAEEW